MNLNRFNFFKIILVILGMLAITTGSVLAKSPVFTNGGKAINGYDPVAYFTASKPVLGKDQYKFNYQGADWFFASEENLALFKNNPEKYAPQYGGYCAYGVSQGYAPPTDPNAWSIVDDKLYLNYNPPTKDRWDGDQQAYIKDANKIWPTLIK